MKVFRVPDSKFRFFIRLYGFLKTIFLTSTHFKEFPGTKIFPDKKCPASGFCLKRHSRAFLHGRPCLVMFWDDYAQLSGPGCHIPVFCPVVRFSKNYIFDISTLQGISWCKNFPGQKVSGFRFLPNLIL